MRFEGLFAEDTAPEEGGAVFEEEDLSDETESQQTDVLHLEPGGKARSSRRYLPRILAAAACLTVGFIGLRQMGNKDMVPTPMEGDPMTSSAGPAGEGEGAEGYSALRNALYKIQSDQGYYTTYERNGMAVTSDGVATSQAAPAPEAAPEENSMARDMVGGEAGLMMKGFAGLGGSKNVYETNVQEKGIDEADVIKTDGTYLYIYRFNSQSGHHEIRILQASNLKHMSTIDLGSASYDGRLYLDGDYMVLVRTRSGADDLSYGEQAQTTSGTLAGDVSFKPEDGGANGTTASADAAQGRMAVAPSIVGVMPGFTSQATVVEVVVYNIKDKKAPEAIATYEQDGSYLTSRYMNGVVYAITNKGVYDRVISSKMPMGRMVPMVGSDRSLDILPAEDVIISDYLAEPNYVTVTATDIRTGERQAKAVLGVANTLYMSEKAIYLTATTYNYGREMEKDESYNHTGIVKLSVDKTNLTHVGGAQVDGYVDGQFAFSEQNGYLRVATTADTQSGSRNNMYVLDSNLSLVGSLENLAPGERIYWCAIWATLAMWLPLSRWTPCLPSTLKIPRTPRCSASLKYPDSRNISIPSTRTPCWALATTPSRTSGAA